MDIRPFFTHVGGQRIVLYAAGEQAEQVLEIIAETLGRSETPPASGTTVQFAWSVFTLDEIGSDLVLCEPDFSRDPFHDLRPDLTCSLAVTAGQTAFLQRTKLEGESCLFRDKVVLQPDCLSKNSVYLERIGGVDPGDSGWFIGEVNRGGAPPPTAGELEAIYTFQLLTLRPALLQALLAPPGTLVVMEGDEVQAVITSEGENVWSA